MAGLTGPILFSESSLLHEVVGPCPFIRVAHAADWR
jgi:hypothetical protein